MLEEIKTKITTWEHPFWSAENLAFETWEKTSWNDHTKIWAWQLLKISKCSNSTSGTDVKKVFFLLFWFLTWGYYGVWSHTLKPFYFVNANLFCFLLLSYHYTPLAICLILILVLNMSHLLLVLNIVQSTVCQSKKCRATSKGGPPHHPKRGRRWRNVYFDSIT